MKLQKIFIIIAVLNLSVIFGQSDLSLSKNEDKCFQKDTITTLGTIIKYKKDDNVFKVSYQDGLFQRTLDDDFECRIDEFGVWDDVPKF